MRTEAELVNGLSVIEIHNRHEYQANKRKQLSSPKTIKMINIMMIVCGLYVLSSIYFIATNGALPIIMTSVGVLVTIGVLFAARKLIEERMCQRENAMNTFNG